MKCDLKTMLKTAGVLGLALAVIYFTVPAAQAFIVASAPILVALICPVSMLFMMKAMNGSPKDDGLKTDEAKAAPRIPDVDPDRA